MITRELVETALLNMGMPANLRGFGYIIDSILLMDKDINVKITYLYFKVAQMNNTSAQRVERAIRHAFEVVRGCRGDYDIVQHYIGFINCSNSASLSMLLMRVREDNSKVKGEKGEPTSILDITEGRLFELMKQAYREVLTEMMTRIK